MFFFSGLIVAANRFHGIHLSSRCLAVDVFSGSIVAFLQCTFSEKHSCENAMCKTTRNRSIRTLINIIFDTFMQNRWEHKLDFSSEDKAMFYCTRLNSQ